MKPIGIIGGGLGGLSSACVLAARGHRVILFERNDWLGGKAAPLAGDGFRFDMGPTILTMPSVLRRIFDEAGARMEDYLELVRLDPQWRCFFEDGSVLDLAQEPAAMARTLDQFAPGTGSGARYREFIDYSARLDRISQRHFFYKPIGGLRDMFDWRSSFDPKMLGDVLAMRMGRSVAGTVRAFTPDARVAQMMDHFTQYVGSSPHGSPAVLCGIAHMQTDEGVWYPVGGTRAVPLALEKLARGLGVEFRTGVKIEKILTSAGVVTGVRTGTGEEVMLGAVVSNSDSVRTHRELIGGAVGARFERRRRYEPACSGVVLYLGLSRRYDHLAHHGFVFSRDPREEFEWIYQKGEPAPDPTCYLAATSRTEPGTAPAGGEALYVLVHTPYLRPHHDWGKMLPDYRRVILEKLKRTGQMPDIEERIVFERVLTPQDIHERYHVLDGAIYGLASHGKFLGAFKPGNRAAGLCGLYLAGGAAHPGPGMPMVLMSGWIAADTLDRDGAGGSRSTGSSLPPVSPVFVKMFAAYSRRYVGRHFHSLRILKSGLPPHGCRRPLVIHLNHAAWWDPLVCLLLAREFFPDRSSYAPIDAAMLGRYGFFRKLGFFGIEPRSASGARAFLRTAHAILDSPLNTLWLTPQGRFTDPRERPPRLEDGLGALAARGPDAVFVPLAIEYAFWTEPRPEILVAFGEPVSTGESRTREEWTRAFTDALEATQDKLAACSCRRDPSDWLTLSRGRTGVGAIYDTWRRLRAKVRGGKFTAGHSPQSAP